MIIRDMLLNLAFAPSHLAVVRVVTWVLAAMVGASATTWALQWPAPTSTPQAPAAEVPQTAIDSSLVARVLGAQPQTKVQADTLVQRGGQFKLHGVIADGARQGSALISVNGMPAKPYPVGREVAPGWVLQAVSGRTATLGASGSAATGLTLELPKLSSP